MRCLIVVLCILLIGVAGSVGPWFPWINLLSAGCLMLIAAKYLNTKVN